MAQVLDFDMGNDEVCTKYGKMYIGSYLHRTMGIYSMKENAESEVAIRKPKCTDPPQPKCELCRGVKDYCGDDKTYVRTTYPDEGQYSFLGCTYPKTYEYVDFCAAEGDEIAVQEKCQEACEAAGHGNKCWGWCNLG